MSQERDEDLRGNGLEGMGEALHGALESWAVPDASEGFRARMRESFLSKGSETSGLRGDAEWPDRLEPSLEGWEVPSARVEFRARLRRQFLAAGAKQTTPLAQSRGRLLTFPRVVATLAAAALVLLLATVLRPTPAAWEVVEFAQQASFQLNGERFSGPVNERVDQALTDEALTDHGCDLATGEDNLTLLHLGEGLLLEIPPGTDLKVRPRVAGADSPFEIDVTRGGLRVATSETFAGRIIVHTPDATIALEGRSIGIDVVPEGTCLCVLAGAADLRGLLDVNREIFKVGSSSTAFVSREGVVSRQNVGDVLHRAELEGFSELGEKYLF